MKQFIFLLILLISFTKATAQQSSEAENELLEAQKGFFDDYCPIYILENYCNTRGFIAIKAKLLADERASDFRSYRDPMSAQAEDSVLWFRYNKSVIGLEYSPRVSHLTNFHVYVKTFEDAYLFGHLYASLMGFVPGESAGEHTKRYISERSNMNAVLVNLEPSNPSEASYPYHIICFVMQSFNFCN
jgi:hypothetical protein